MIIKTLSVNDAWNEVQQYGDGYKNKFSREGFDAIFNYYDDFSTDTRDNRVEFDFIAWCCDWTEYESLDEVKQDYNNIETLEDLLEKTAVLGLENDRLVVANY